MDKSMIKVYKDLTDKQHLYSQNNLKSIDEAMKDLKTIPGLKLYWYISKNQRFYKLSFSIDDFCQWANLQKSDYEIGFNELFEKGYITKNQDNSYSFFDKAGNQEFIERITKAEKQAQFTKNNLNITIIQQ